MVNLHSNSTFLLFFRPSSLYHVDRRNNFSFLVDNHQNAFIANRYVHIVFKKHFIQVFFDFMSIFRKCKAFQRTYVFKSLFFENVVSAVDDRFCIF